MREIFELKHDLKKIKENSYYLGIIQNLYAGSEGEINNFLQLMYQVNSLSLFEEEYSELFYEMALQELKHSHFLAQLIISLGGDPVYISAQGKWLGGRSFDYIKNIKQMISYNLETKEKNIVDYISAISKINDTEIISKLKEILEEEKYHKYLLENINKKFKK